MIEVKNLVKQYGDHLAVDHLSFTVETGQIYGFLGPNGAGKSTTMNMMTGYLGASSGEVLVDGHSILQQPDLCKRSIGYLPEQPPVYFDMTVAEYLTFAAEIKRVPRADRADQLVKIMDMTHLTEMSGRLIGNLSKGYRQRVGLACALVGFPDILILDEPTVGLDPQQIIEIRSLIKTLSKDHTILLSSHILSEVQAVCDHILIIHHGKKIASGSPEELQAQMKGKSKLCVLVKNAHEQLAENLSALAGVTRVTPAACAEPGVTSLVIEADKGAKDLRECVFHTCCAQGGILLELHTETAGLEQIFLALIAESAETEKTVPSLLARRRQAKAQKIAAQNEALSSGEASALPDENAKAAGSGANTEQKEADLS